MAIRAIVALALADIPVTVESGLAVIQDILALEATRALVAILATMAVVSVGIQAAQE